MGNAGQRQEATQWAARWRWLRRVIGPWQPLTGRGVATFRAASLPRVLAFQFLVAALSAVVLAWTVRRTWFPVVFRGLERLPEAAGIEEGRLQWPDTVPVRLSENAWLDWVVTPAPTSPSTELGQTADLQVELRRDALRIHGLAGHVTLPYRSDLTMPLGRVEAAARWGAWNWVLLAGLGLATGITLMVTWWVLATLYALPVLLLGFLMGRRVRLLGAWRIASAALLTGALFADWAILAYGIGAVRLPGFGLLFAGHALVGGWWLVWGVLRCPATNSPEPDNPFADPGSR